MAISVGLLGLFTSGSALALTPPLPAAKVVYANGGRVLTMDADGTDRKVIFGKNRNPKNDLIGGTEPVASPDGETVAFAYKLPDGNGINDLFDIWTVGIDGRGATQILKSNARIQYGDPTFLPDGRVLVAFFKTSARRTVTGLISVHANGDNRKTEYRMAQRRRPYVAPKLVMEPDVDRRGKRVVYVLNDGFAGANFDEGFNNPLMVLNLDTGKGRKLTEGAYEAAWSPNGDRIAYTLQTQDDDLMTCWWQTGCEFTSSLAIIKSDGSGRRILLGRKLDERSPDWSTDNRIVFHSARNLPGTGEASEIWSVTPTGGCLTPLTNGSPASLTPAWVGAATARTRPAECGRAPRPRGEVDVPSGIAQRKEILWMGETPGTRLLTDASMAEGGTAFLYNDCVNQKRSRCQPPAGVWRADVCVYRGYFSALYGDQGQARWQRGARVFVDRGSELGPFVLVVAGRSITFISGGSGKGRQLGRAEVDQLRRMGEEEPSGDLPVAKFPAGDINQMKRVIRIYEASGSVPVTARRTGLSRSRVRDNLRFGRLLQKSDEYEIVDCST
ncbi:MAG: PD40 domain-containing protein [Solirubrobacterales bacterium]|nr:PD40 domain-containing protein [Solirubrobacterales bacterium]